MLLRQLLCFICRLTPAFCAGSVPNLLNPIYLMNELAMSLSFPEILEFPETPLRLNFSVLSKYTIHRLSDIERSRIQ
ncbi:hypothetical protein C8R32_102263 [Nitrosospira sp. Nsp5]|nr:hypothetical protein C8R32_102263 [Nitrosospira sp. Nsp5]